MTLEEGLFYTPLPLKYVLLYRKESMLSSHPVVEDPIEDWECLDCPGPPPHFYLPPPPCPPASDSTPGDFWTCPVAAGDRGEAAADDTRVSIAVVVVTAATCVLLAVVATVIVFRRRLHRDGRSSKSPPVDGAIIYDDLTAQSVPPGSVTTIDPSRRQHQMLWTPLDPRSHPRYVQPPIIDRPHVRYKITRGQNPHSVASTFAEPVYHTISSESGSGMSSQCPSDGGRIPVSPLSHRPRRQSESEEEDSLTPFLRPEEPQEDSDSPRSPSHARYYLSVPLGSGTPFRPPSVASSTHTSSHDYETLPLRASVHGGSSLTALGRPLTPQERGLPPLPSRSERFRMFLPQQEKMRQQADKRFLSHRQERYLYPKSVPSSSPCPAGEVLYENIGLSSRL